MGIFLASLYLHPQPLEEVFGVARAGHRVKQKSSPFGLLLRLSGKREFNLCSPIILGLKMLRFVRFTFEFPSNSFDRFLGTGITVLCPP